MNSIKKIKIAIMATVASYGGAEKVVIDQISALMNLERFEPILLVYSRKTVDDKFFSHLSNLKIKKYSIVLNRHRLKYFNPISNIFETIRILKKENPKIIHSHGYRANIIALIVSRILSVLVVTTCHGYIFTDFKLNLYNRIDLFVIKQFKKVIAVSKSLKEYLIQKGIINDRIVVLKNAVDTSQQCDRIGETCDRIRQNLSIRENCFVCGYIGRISPEKGLLYLINGFSKLKKNTDKYYLMVIGDGEERENCELLAGELLQQGRIKFLGFQNNVKELLAAMDCIVLPSLTEGTPMVLLEAMSMEVPIIATRVGGVPDIIIHNDNGLLVDSMDSDAIAAAIEKLYSDKELRKKLAKNARLLVQDEYDIQKWSSVLIDMYNKMLSV